MMKRLLVVAGLVLGGMVLAREESRFDFQTFFVTWTGNGEEWVVPYVREAQPEVAQICFFGPMFHAYADEQKSTGYPMQLPVAGQVEAVRNQQATIRAIQEAGAKVVVHFQMTNVIDGDGEAENLWAKLLTERWPEELLGPRPELAPEAYLQRDAEGTPLRRQGYHISYLGLCMSNPATRELRKRMLKLALDSGADGIMTNYNYYWGCVCEHCQTSFKAYLRNHHTPDELKAMGIAELDSHQFERIPAASPGYPEEVTPLALAAERWAAIAFKACFDELLIDYGRTIRPGLILAAWNHLGYLGVGEERAFLPIDLWGKGEDYFWYSGGYGPTKLEEGKLGEGWLDCLYMRELGGGKPFVLGKYEGIRIRNSMAEGLASGGIGMGLRMPMDDPAAHAAGVAYTRFVHENRPLYAERQPLAEIGLLLSRQALMNGHRQAMDTLKLAGEAMAREQLLFDLIVDERLTAGRLEGCRALVVPLPAALDQNQRDVIAAFAERGGKLFTIGDGDLMTRNGREKAAWKEGLKVQPITAERLAAELKKLPGVSRISAPWTVRAAAYTVPDGLALHLVNYDRDEAAATKPVGPKDEHPRAAMDIAIELTLPANRQVQEVWLLSPDGQIRQQLEATWLKDEARVAVVVPELLVYAVLKVVLTQE